MRSNGASFLVANAGERGSSYTSISKPSDGGDGYCGGGGDTYRGKGGSNGEGGEYGSGSYSGSGGSGSGLDISTMQIANFVLK